MSNLVPLPPISTPANGDAQSWGDGTLAVFYRVQGGAVENQDLGRHFTPNNDCSVVTIRGSSAKFKKLAKAQTISKPKSALVHSAWALPISAAVLTLVVIIVSASKLSEYESNKTVISLIWAGATVPFLIYQIVAGFVGRVNYAISFAFAIVLAAGAVAGGVLAAVVRDAVGAPLIFVTAAIYIADAVVLALVSDISRLCRVTEQDYYSCDDEEEGEDITLLNKV